MSCCSWAAWHSLFGQPNRPHGDHPRLQLGQPVVVAWDRRLDREYVADSVFWRRALDGHRAVVVGYTSSLGLCYAVRSGDRLAWYEPAELRLLLEDLPALTVH